MDRLDGEFDGLPTDLKELYGRDFFNESFNLTSVALKKLASDPQLVFFFSFFNFPFILQAYIIFFHNNINCFLTMNR